MKQIKHRTIIANWKMYFSYNQSVEFIKNYGIDLANLCTKSSVQLIICPTAPALSDIKKLLTRSPLLLGGQGCSAHTTGAYTGEISAMTLREAGCNVCIIGHAERRTYHQETSDIVSQQYAQLVRESLSPVVCIGENSSQRTSNQTHGVIEEQLTPILETLKILSPSSQPLVHYVAYEPVWAIGTGMLPTQQELSDIVAYIYAFLTKHAPTTHWKILYGGSVTATLAGSIINIPHLDGLLVGGASTNINELKNVISSMA